MSFKDDYTILDELGQGGFAKVYKARHNKLGYIRAIRVLNSPIVRGEKDTTYQKFLEECKILLRLGNGNNPNIVNIYQPLLIENIAIVEMDYVEGKDLFRYLENQTFFIKAHEVIQLLTDIGGALAYCHEDVYKYCMDKELDDLEDDPENMSRALVNEKDKTRLIKKYRVIHNDIHSGNIIRRDDGRYVLLDFGLAIEGGNVIRSSKREGGAPEYKSPEKWENNGILTTESDIYSFGVVLYEMLAGRVPFPFNKELPNSNEAEYLVSKAHKDSKPEGILELRKEAYAKINPETEYVKDYPDWIETVIMKCLEKEPKDRYKNGKELYDEVLKFIENDRTDHLTQDIKRENIELKDKLKLLADSIESTNTSRDEAEKLLQEKIAQAETNNVNLTSQIASLQEESTTLKSQLENEKEKASKVEQNNATLSEQISTLQEKNNELKAQLNDLFIDVSFDDNDSNSAEFEDKINELEAKLKASQRKADSLKSKNEKFESEINNLYKENKHLRSQTEDLFTDVSIDESETIAELRATIRDLQHRLSGRR